VLAQTHLAVDELKATIVKFPIVLQAFTTVTLNHITGRECRLHASKL
jgi:hypothetical protein